MQTVNSLVIVEASSWASALCVPNYQLHQEHTVQTMNQPSEDPRCMTQHSHIATRVRMGAMFRGKA
jgi:hypothetical protein